MAASGALPPPIWVSAPSSPARRRGGLLGADREGDLGMVLRRGAEEEVAGRRGEGQQHQQQEAGERPPVPRPGARRQRRRRGDGLPRRRRGVAGAGGGAASSAPRRAPRRRARRAPGRARPPRPARAPGRERRRAARVVRAGTPSARRFGLSSGGGVIGPLDRPSRRHVRRTAGLVIAAPPGLPLAPDESKPPRGERSRRCRRRSRHPPRRSRRRSGPAGRASSGCG